MADIKASESCEGPNEELRAAFQTLSLLRAAIESLDYSDLRYDLMWEEDPADAFTDQYIANAKVQIVNVRNLSVLLPAALNSIENFLNTPISEE